MKPKNFVNTRYMSEEKELASIKKPGQTDQVTKEEFEKRIREIAKSKRDICYWAENYFRIVSLNTGLTTISLYQKQRELLQALVNNDRSIVLASRQVGKCVFKDSIITIRSKKTGITQNITIEDFFKLVAQQNAYNLQEAEMHSFAGTERKFIQSFDVEDYKILADDGWQECKAIHKTIQYQIWELQTMHLRLKCADNHIVFDENMNEIFVKDLHPGKFIQTQNGLEEVITCKCLDISDNMYDAELASTSNHRYYTNGILSHNTTCYTVFCMWMATLFPEKKIMICANKLQTAIEIMDRMRLAYEYLPQWIKPGILVYNKAEITFSNMSSIRAFATSSSASRGFSGQILVIDEMAFIPKNVIDEFFASVMPVVSSAKNSKAIVVSTPNGTSGLYYDLWCQANSKKSNENKEGWKPFRIDWWEVPNRDEEWKEKQIASIGMARWRQEFCNEFIASSSVHKLIPDDVLERYRMKLSEYKTLGILPKKQKIVSQAEDEIFEFDMWHEFDANRTYLASADISEGVGADASVLYIWDVTDLADIKMCAKFSSNTISVVQFAYIANKILTLYCDPWLFAERNGISGGMLDSLRITYGYQHIAVENKKGQPGIYSHVQVKGKACLWARDMLSTQGFGFTIYDKDLIDEFAIFAKKDTKGLHCVYQALPGANSHDDHVMTFIWMCYALHNERVEQYFTVCQTFTTYTQQIYAKILLPLEDYESNRIANLKKDPLYAEFLEFKEEVQSKLQTAMQKEAEEDKSDPMFQNIQTRKNDDLLYFGEDSGSEWSHLGFRRPSLDVRSNQNQASQQLRPLNRSVVIPSFYIN